MRSSQAYEAVLPHQHNLQVPFPQLIKHGRPVTPQPSASLVGMSRHLTDISAREASTGSKDLVKDLVNHWQLDVLPVAWSACSGVHFQPASLPAAATGVFGVLLSGGIALGHSGAALCGLVGLVGLSLEKLRQVGAPHTSDGSVYYVWPIAMG